MSGEGLEHGCATSADPGSGTSRALWDERLRSNTGESSVGCAGFGVQYNRWLYRLRARVFSRTVKRLWPGDANIRVLDVGTGTGFYIRQWQRHGVHRIEGLDFSPSGIEILRQRFPGVPFHLADIGQQPLEIEQGAYDVVSAFDVLFHIVDDARYQAAMNNLVRCLKPGGILLFTENFVHHERPRVSDYHYSRTLHDIERTARDAGLVMEQRHPIFVLMNAPDDSTHPALTLWWRMVSKVAQRGEWLGWLAGACLFPLDGVLTRVLREGPSTELAVCRRVTDTRDRTET